ncbi:universal stress protein [Taklimakanibacter lacteus]|uniref:universal stress protein n=1 Tax=Taklimakanibacter lacteus TaxID=2268456 RepID=UPI000E65ECB2
MKSIFVAVSGTSSDNSVLDAAHAIATPLHAHLDFVHIPLASIEVAEFNHHIEFARGGALETALKELLPKSEDAAMKARMHVTDFCTSRNILRMSSPTGMSQVTASWIASPLGPGINGIIRAARAHDLIVIGRSAVKRSWSQSLLENLVTDCGRPVLIIPPGSATPELNKIAIWWKDHGAAARAVSAALPVLAAARKVAVMSVLEKDDHAADGAVDLANQLRWHGMETTTEILRLDHRATIDVLWSASLAARADLVVMGGFSRSRIREMVFGGCTQAVLEAGARPIFLLH